MSMYIRESRCIRVGTWPGRGGCVVGGREKKREEEEGAREGKGAKRECQDVTGCVVARCLVRGAKEGNAAY